MQEFNNRNQLESPMNCPQVGSFLKSLLSLMLPLSVPLLAQPSSASINHFKPAQNVVESINGDTSVIPAGLGFIAGRGGSSFAVAASDNIVYLGEGRRLVIYDGSDPDDFVLLGHSDYLESPIVDVQIDDQYIYLLAGTTFYVLDGSDLSEPTVVGQMIGLTYAHQLAVSEDRAYIVRGIRKIRTLDISDPTNPIMLSNGIPMEPGTYLEIVVQGDIAYVLTTTGILVYNLLIPDSPVLIQSIVMSGVSGLVIKDEYLLISGAEALLLFAISPTHSLIFAGSLPFEGDLLRDLAIIEDIVYLSASYEIIIVDISMPESPIEIGRMAHSSTEEHLNIRADGSRIYTVGGSVRAFDVTDPKDPLELIVGVNSGLVRSINIVDDMIYVGSTDQFAVYQLE